MKILKEGDIKKTYPWWTKVPWHCGSCGCEVQFEPGDTHLVKEYHDQREGDWAEADCPTCGKRMARDMRLC